MPYPDQRSEPWYPCSSLYVEGVNTGSGNIVLKYKDPSGTEICFDKVKYTFITADCGDQPRTEGEHYPGAGKSQREDFEDAFPNLKRCEWSITDNRVTQEYNCIAWSVDDTTHRYWKLDTIEGTNIIGIDEEYGDNNDIFELHADLDPFYQVKKGYTPTASGPNDAKVIYYSNYHAAKKKECSCGGGKWIIFESKCGDWEHIEHVWDQLNDSVYGTPVRFYK